MKTIVKFTLIKDKNIGHFDSELWQKRFDKPRELGKDLADEA
jgi:hypothetical protein